MRRDYGIEIECPHCGVRENSRCMTKNGKETTIHAKRTSAYWDRYMAESGRSVEKWRLRSGEVVTLVPDRDKHAHVTIFVSDGYGGGLSMFSNLTVKEESLPGIAKIFDLYLSKIKEPAHA